MSCFLAALLLLVLAFTSGLGAQARADSASSAPRVRVWPADHTDPFLGTLHHYSADSIALLTSEGSLVLPRDSIITIEVSEGVHTNAWRGLKTGALAGAAVGLGVGILAWSSEERANIVPHIGANWIWLGSAMGAVTGSVLGLGFGSLTRSEHWRRMSLDESATRPLVMWRDGRMLVGVAMKR
jgi:hypothetical protein